jgi:hypothetical protein
VIGFGQKQSLDDDEAGARADVPFNPRQLMAWRNESPHWIGSNALVLAHAQLKRREALLRAAFADKERGLELRRLADVVVDLSEMVQALGRAPKALGCVSLAHACQVQLGGG